MDFLTELFDFLFSITILDIVKGAIIMALVVYTIFAFIVARQVNLKRRTVQTTLGNFLELLAIFHLVGSILLTIFAILVL
jgi:hypothetical protein